MKDRVAVQAYYEYERIGVMQTRPPASCHFFCEVPKAWIAERDRLTERLFAVCETDLKNVCEAVNAREVAASHYLISWHDRISLKSVEVTVLTLIEMQARPWRYTSAGDPFERSGATFPRYCLITDETGAFSGIDADDFHTRAEEDLELMSLSQPRVQKDELISRDIFGKSFLYYGDRLITDTGNDAVWSDWASGRIEGRTYTRLLYRLSERDLIVSKELIEYVDHGRRESLSVTYFRSANNGASWQGTPDFDTAALKGLPPVSDWL